jgi:hypothetical protein
MLAGVMLAPAPSHATDLPLAGTLLRLVRSGAGEKLVLVLDDPSIPAPGQGSADNPALTGLSVTLFAHDAPGEIADLVAPSGLGQPGWKYGTTGFLRYRFRNGAAPGGISPIRLVALREGKGLRVVAKDVGIGLAGAQGSVGVRIEMGSIRLCALFGADSILRDQAGLFVAKNAPPPGIVECSDEALFGVPCNDTLTCGGTCPDGSLCGGEPALGVGCTCIAGDQPCGDTAPICNGTCPTGEECTNVGGVPYPSCACLPAGSVGCGTVYPTCGDGDCPAGTGCFTSTFTCCGGFTVTGCECLTGPPPPPCGGPCPPGSNCLPAAPGFPEGCYPITCSGGTACPSGSVCTIPPGLSIELCAPIACTGGSGYPTCDGTCDPGLTCQGFGQFGGACYCAP